jgi:hypothetical protein
MSDLGRYCCKSRFGQVVKNSAGRGLGFPVTSGGTSSPHAKLIGDFGSATEATRIIGLGALQVLAKNLDRCNFRFLQQYRHFSEVVSGRSNVSFWEKSGQGQGAIRLLRLTQGLRQSS